MRLLRNVINEAHIPYTTRLMVNPYKCEWGNDLGGLTLCSEIAKETGCVMDAGSWTESVTFLPYSNLEYNNVLTLLETFGLSYTRFPGIK
ncbi:hypothetical protein D3C78_1448670 [compost metagenome]